MARMLNPNGNILYPMMETILIRQEMETEISETCYQDYVGEVKYNIVSKNRYYSPLSDGLIAELDIFKEHLEGLILVEVEFDNESSAKNFEVPYWFGQEVTNLKEYKNNNLAKSSDITSLPY